MSYRPNSSRLAAGLWTRRTHVLALAGGLVATLLTSATHGQVITRRVGPNAGRATEEKEKESGVFVRDSGVAIEKLALAERMEGLKEWNKSADVYQEILEKFSDRVLPSRTDKEGKTEQYSSVALVVQEKLSRWPEAGLAVYRSRYEETARQLIEAAPDDRGTLAKVFSNYFVTEAGKQAGQRLISLSLERGEFTAAAWTGDRLLALHPTLAAERPTVLYQTALALHLSNNDARVEEKLVELSGKFADATGTVRGQDVALAKSLAEELKAEPGLTRAVPAGSWPTAFGGPERATVPPSAVDGGAPLFNVDLTLSKPRGPNARVLQTFRNNNRSDRLLGKLTGIFPVVDRGELFFHDNARVYALALDTGRPLPGWLATYPGDKRAAFATDAWPLPEQRQLTLSVTDREVLAVLGQADAKAMSMPAYGGVGPATQLVCLERATGKRLWSIAPRTLKLPESAAALRDAQFFGSPLVVGNTVYVSARTTKPGQIEDSHVVALNLGDGAYAWSSYVASAATGSVNEMQFDPESIAGPVTTSHLAFADGRVFVQTNLGALASLDAADGKILWLSLYPRYPSDVATLRRIGRPRQLRPQASDPRAFTFNPPMLVGGRLFALPSDSPSVLVFDSGTGQLLMKIRRDMPAPTLVHRPGEPVAQPQRMDTLVGVAGERLVLAGENSVYCIKWPAYAEEAPAAAWLKWVKAQPDTSPAWIQGRPFMTSDVVLFTTAAGLTRVDLNGGKVVSTFPASGKWDEGQGPGNVLATADYLIVAGAENLNVYTDLGLARKKLAAEIAAAPTSADPLLKYAEMMFAAGERGEALARLDVAIETLGGRAALAIGPGRDRLFEDAIAFAGKLGRDPKGTTALADELFDRARDAAFSPVQQARYRLARAEASKLREDAKTEVALLQEILVNPAWRQAQPTGAESAGRLAMTGIAEAIKRAGGEVYAPVEQQAAAALEAAKAQAGAAPLVEIAEAYPNSAAVPSALDVAAQRVEAAGDHRDAARLLRRLYPRLTSNDARLRVLESLARNYLTLPGGEPIAVARLMQGNNLAPQAALTGALTLPDGRVVENVSFREAAELLRLRQSKQDGSALPTLGFSPPGDKARGTPPVAVTVTINDVAKIVKPASENARYDRVVVWHPAGGLTVYAAGSSEPRARVADFSETPLTCFWQGDKVAVVGQTRVVLIDDASGKVLWTASATGLAGGDALAAGAESAPAEEPAPNNNQFEDDNIQQMLIQRQMRGRMVVNGRVIRIDDPNAVDADGDGLPDAAGAADAGPDQIVRAKLLADRLVVCTSTSRVAAFDLGTGKSVWATRVSDDAPRHFMAIEEFVVVTTYDEAQVAKIVVLDAATGQVVSRRQQLANPDMMLANIALSPDGTLVLATGSGLTAFDLYDPSAKELWVKRVRKANEMPFLGSTGREQMVIHNGHILIVSYPQTPAQAVRSYELSNGSESAWRPTPDERREVKINVPSASPNPLPLYIRVAGDRVYVYNQLGLTAASVDRAEELHVAFEQRDSNTADLLVGSDYVVQVNTPKNSNGDRVPSIKLLAYATRDFLPNGDQNFGLHATALVPDPRQLQVNNWQGVDGGMYYVTGDQKLKFLKVLPAAP